MARPPMLLHAGVPFAAMPAIFLERVREALSAAERQLFFQGWHPRQLLPEWPPGEQNLGVLDLRPCEDVYFL